MKTLGIDIGTTTISLVVQDSLSGILGTRNLENGTFLPGLPWERVQDPEKILEKVKNGLQEMLAQFPQIQAIGVTGQMHGIVYLDGEGRAVSPLYTWQDGRGDLPFDDGVSWASRLSEITGYPLSTGYGLVTHFYNQHHNLVPPEAAAFCTISDYVAMALAGVKTPRLDATNAASLGIFDCVRGCFDFAAMEKAGISPHLLPSMAETPLLGVGMPGIPVFTAIGDNQASFLGAAGGRRDVLLVNMGTGGQVSVYSPDYLQTGGLETRPFPGGGWLLVGASLCGGRSYALLERFFRQTVQMVTGQDIPAYDAMARMLEMTRDLDNLPTCDTTFQGTRTDPTRRAVITGLDENNFTPAHLTWSVMEGMARELYEMYRSFLEAGGEKPVQMIGSGNGLRKNPWLRRVFENVFQCPMQCSPCEEEAAWGAALYAAQNI